MWCPKKSMIGYLFAKIELRGLSRISTPLTTPHQIKQKMQTMRPENCLLLLWCISVVCGWNGCQQVPSESDGGRCLISGLGGRKSTQDFPLDKINKVVNIIRLSLLILWSCTCYTRSHEHKQRLANGFQHPRWCWWSEYRPNQSSWMFPLISIRFASFRLEQFVVMGRFKPNPRSLKECMTLYEQTNFI